MNVAQLIAKLNKLDPNLPVLGYHRLDLLMQPEVFLVENNYSYNIDYKHVRIEVPEYGDHHCPENAAHVASYGICIE